MEPEWMHARLSAFQIIAACLLFHLFTDHASDQNNTSPSASDILQVQQLRRSQQKRSIEAEKSTTGRPWTYACDCAWMSCACPASCSHLLATCHGLHWSYAAVLTSSVAAMYAGLVISFAGKFGCRCVRQYIV